MASNLASPTFKESHGEAHPSGVSWGAVAGGAFVTAALAVILLALGAGLGLSSVSPWAHEGVPASAVGTMAIVWLILVEAISSAMGGYLTGRLRTKWATIHTDEVYFRDTANGFLSWSVALVISVAFLASGATSMTGGAAQGGASEAAGASGEHNDYFVDTLLRSDHPTTDANDGAAQMETSRILVNALAHNEISQADNSYLSQLIATKTGITQADADKRIGIVVAEARQAEDAARKASARLLLWTFLALLIGAFCASYAATIGGRQRDHVKLV